MCVCVFLCGCVCNKLEKKTSTSICVNNNTRTLKTVQSVLLTLPSLQIDTGSLKMPKKMTASSWMICLFLLGSVTEVKDYLPHYLKKNVSDCGSFKIQSGAEIIFLLVNPKISISLVPSTKTQQDFFHWLSSDYCRKSAL